MHEVQAGEIVRLTVPVVLAVKFLLKFYQGWYVVLLYVTGPTFYIVQLSHSARASELGWLFRAHRVHNMLMSSKKNDGITVKVEHTCASENCTHSLFPMLLIAVHTHEQRT